MHDHVIGRGAEHHRNFASKLLWILIMRVDVHGAIGFDISDGHGWANRCMLHVRELICGGKLLVSRREHGADVTFARIALRNRRSGPVRLFSKVLVEFCAAR